MRFRRLLYFAGSAAAIGVVVVIYLFRPIETANHSFEGLTGDARRGAYLARASGCFSCHTDAPNGGKTLAGGAALKTPFGTFYAPNITTHPEDGIGLWTVSQFAGALRQGTSPNGQNYYPVFLYPNYTKLSDQDIVDLWEAFRTVPPVAQKVPDHELKFPFRFRFLLNAWKRLFFTPGRYVPDATKSEQWNRGAFLATGPTHCVACHTPRNLFGARDYDHELSGNPDGPDQEKVPPINAAALKKGGWEKDDIVFALQTGSQPDGDTFGGSMGEVVRDSTRFLTAEDLEAIAEYVLSVDP